ncbi:hypothetical protein [Acidothermus cellulolyticus]|uniref:hypothetical protein n=1 Tax=Acidothermus cellulolyticus TaxID=28049 RepID=UPI0002D50A2B|nr:hypothetical protein [Acidothermus cellulolyticus]
MRLADGAIGQDRLNHAGFDGRSTHALGSVIAQLDRHTDPASVRYHLLAALTLA